jgi:hypothetical protein
MSFFIDDIGLGAKKAIEAAHFARTNYSYLRATIGSTFIALRAGT